MVDFRIVENLKLISKIIYLEFREFFYMGVLVLYEDVIFLVRKVGILINIKNINKL